MSFEADHARAKKERSKNPTLQSTIIHLMKLMIGALITGLTLSNSVQAQCGPSPIGVPCGGAGIASQGQNSGANLGAGNPIHLASGNKAQTEMDLSGLPGTLGLEVIRHYNSLDPTPGVLGIGWRLSYDTQAYMFDGSVQIRQADGQRLRFRVLEDRPECLPEQPGSGVLRWDDPAGQRQLIWQWRDGRVLQFDAKGYLTLIVAPTGEQLRLDRYADGSLARIFDAQGRQLQFHYTPTTKPDGNRRLIAIQYEDGAGVSRELRYQTGPRGELAGVTYPDGRARRYHYGEPSLQSGGTRALLTGISAWGKGQAEVRTHSWGYDHQGRAILSVKGPADSQVERVSINYGSLEKGQRHTEVRNAQGKITRFHLNSDHGQWQLAEVSGDGCPGCETPGSRYIYDSHGRLERRERPNLVEVFQYDELDRVRRYWQLSHAQASASAVSLDENTASLIMDYLDDTGLPARIARSSRVPGLKQTWQIHYRRVRDPSLGAVEVWHYLPDSLRWEGFSPPDEMSAKPVFLSREWRWEWVAHASSGWRIAAQHLHADLPSAAVSRQSLRYRYNAQGLPTSVELTSDLRQTWQRDRQGQILVHTPWDGVPVRYERDALGRTTAISRAGRRVRLNYDAAQRWTGLLGPQNEWAQDELDGADRPVARWQGWIDTPKNLDVAWLTFWQRGDNDQLIAIHALSPGRHHQMAASSDGEMTHQNAPPDAEKKQPFPLEDASKLTAQLAPSVQIDDLGRVVSRCWPTSGCTHWRYNLLNLPILQRDADGTEQQWTYDLAGRLLEHRVQAPQKAPIIIQWQHHGVYPIKVKSRHETRNDRYDANGQLIETLRQRPGLPDMLTRYRYDALGNLLEITHPDGGRLRYSRNSQGQLIAIDYQAYGQTTNWLSMVRDVSGTPYGAGIDSFLSGDGLRTRWLRDSQGRPEELQVFKSGKSGKSTFTASPPSVVLAWQLRFDAAQRLRGFLSYRRQKPSETAQLHHEQFYTDAEQRFTARFVRQARADGHWPERGEMQEAHAYHADGTPAFLPAIQYDSSGRRVSQAARHYDYDALGRLQRVVLTEQRAIKNSNAPKLMSEVVYRYDASGQRISRSVSYPSANRLATLPSIDGFIHEERRIAIELSGNELRHRYVYLSNHLVARIDGATPIRSRQEQDDPWERFKAHIKQWLNPETQVEPIYIHTDFRGAPQLAFDGQTQLRWAAQTTSFGRVTVTHNQLASPLQMRLPGQREDELTGLFDNLHRDYDPNRGQYLTPDPLGMPDGPDRHAYVNYRPWEAIDPLGLILFAFDGTGNAETPLPGDSITNVRKFYDLFSQGNDQEERFYIAGVGRDDEKAEIKTNFWDVYDANTARERVNYMLKKLKEQLETKKNIVVPIDVIGFSRGAAMARDFVNQVAININNSDFNKGACLRLRFLGLWDTVAQFGLYGTQNDQWQLTIPDEVQTVVQAVAVNEHRTFFPVESIFKNSTQKTTQKRLEVGFLGSHADIGGGYGTGDLSDVALQWMVQEAKKAGVPLKNLQKAEIFITDPILHSKNSVDRDREFRYGTSNGKYVEMKRQNQVNLLGLTTRESRKFFKICVYFSKDCKYQSLFGKSEELAVVDIQAYKNWLNKEKILYEIGVSQ